MRERRFAGNDADATSAVYVACGSAVMRQIVEISDVFMECGRDLANHS